jgi:hypothetical protein
MIGARHVKFCMERDHYYAYKYYIEHFRLLAFTNMATVQNFEVISHKFNVLGICTNGNYVQKYITK